MYAQCTINLSMVVMQGLQAQTCNHWITYQACYRTDSYVALLSIDIVGKLLDSLCSFQSKGNY